MEDISSMKPTQTELENTKIQKQIQQFEKYLTNPDIRPEDKDKAEKYLLKLRENPRISVYDKLSIRHRIPVPVGLNLEESRYYEVEQISNKKSDLWKAILAITPKEINIKFLSNQDDGHVHTTIISYHLNEKGETIVRMAYHDDERVRPHVYINTKRLGLGGKEYTSTEKINSERRVDLDGEIYGEWIFTISPNSERVQAEMIGKSEFRSSHALHLGLNNIAEVLAGPETLFDGTIERIPTIKVDGENAVRVKTPLTEFAIVQKIISERQNLRNKRISEALNKTS